MSKISLHGAYFPNNYGDVLILAIQAKWIQEITKKEVVLPFATEIYRNTIDVSNISGKQGIISSDKLIYGAGGYLGEPYTNKWRWGFNFIKNHLLPYKIAKKNNIKHAIIGTGAGEVTNLFARSAVKKICNDASIISVRDEESRDILLKYGIDESKIDVTADVALSLTKKDIPISSIKKIKDLLRGSNNSKFGVHLGINGQSSIFSKKTELLLEESIAFLNKYDHITPVLIIDNDNKAQNNAVQYLKKKLINKCIIYKHDNIWETTALLSELDVVLTNKLHIGIVSYALGCIPISIPYHPKTIRFYRQIQQKNLCIPLLDLQKGDVSNLLNSTQNPGWVSRVTEKQNNIRRELKNKALKNKEYIEQFLNSK